TPAVTAAAARPTVTAAPAAPASDDDSDAAAAGADHDGLTVLSSDVVALRRQLPEWAGDAVPGPFAVPAPQAPPVAKIHLSSGLVIALNRPVLLGRAPQVSRVTNSRLPRLVTVASPNQDISRTHAEVRQEGEHVLVTDLRSTNGVLLLRQGHGPQRLHPAEPTVVEPGVVVDLGEGVTFTVEHG
ncbi:FHA domain-containing protein, partial [Cellulomonas carbonis]